MEEKQMLEKVFKEIFKNIKNEIKSLQKQIKEDSSVDINKLIKDFVSIKGITRTSSYH